MRKAIIVDIDGTLADTKHRERYLEGVKEWDKFHEASIYDNPISEIVQITNFLANMGDYTVFLSTGRPERYRQITENWLINKARLDGIYQWLYMRPEKSFAPDYTIKYNHLADIQKEYQVVLAIDDKGPVAEMYLHNGIRVLHVRNSVLDAKRSGR